MDERIEQQLGPHEAISPGTARFTVACNGYGGAAWSWACTSCEAWGNANNDTTARKVAMLHCEAEAARERTSRRARTEHGLPASPEERTCPYCRVLNPGHDPEDCPLQQERLPARRCDECLPTCARFDQPNGACERVAASPPRDGLPVRAEEAK